MKESKSTPHPGPMTPSPSLGRSSADSRSEAHSFRRSSAEVPEAERVASGQVTHVAGLPLEQRFLTKPQMADVLQVSITTLNLMMKRGEVPFLKINNRLVRFRLEDVQRRLTETCLRTVTAPAGAEVKK